MISQTKILVAMLLITNAANVCVATKPFITEKNDSLAILQNSGLWNGKNPLNLHLGCGETHFNGYINIDFPPSEHTVQITSKADVYADLNKLSFPQETVSEIRSHHVFEHFNRSKAMALLCKWHQWLKVGGTLVIETPDFGASLNLLQNPSLSFAQKQVVMRHVFGSHEADWAIHCDGWYKEKYEHILKYLGFENIRFEFTQWKLTHNIIVRATKSQNCFDIVLQQKAKALLREHMVDNSSSEENMWQVWCKEFQQYCSF
jgi:predicted SAM-dependent methyltransferase